MRAVLNRSSLVAILGALAMAFALAMVVLSSSAGAQATEKRAWCHATGSSTNPFVIVVVQKGGPQDVAHEGHPDDILIDEGPDLKHSDFDAATDCPGAPPTTTTTTSVTPPPTSTTGNVVNTTANTTSISVTTSGNCVQTAIQQQVGNTNVAGGDIINFQNRSQERNITITQAKKAAKTFGVSKFGKVVKPSKVVATQYVSSASAKTVTATASAKTVTASAKTVTASAAPSVQYQYAAPAVQYQYSAPVALPETGGSSLLVPVGALLLLAGGGLLAFFVERRGFTG